MNKPFRSYNKQGIMKRHQTLTFAEYRAKQHGTRVDYESTDQITTIRNYQKVKWFENINGKRKQAGLWY